MNQDEGAGHSEITRLAVQQLFAERGEVGADGVRRVHGMTEADYAAQLDAAQEHQDRTVDFSDLPNQLQHGAPLGPTVRPSSWDPDVQRQHAMADPSRSGGENLAIDRQYVVDQLDAAHSAAYGSGDSEMAHLGAAVHATEDSYSEAHTFRGDAVHSGDATAPIQAINNFDWTHMTATGDGANAVLLEGTHDARFDYAPVTHDASGQAHEVLGTDRAAVTATASVLEHYEDARGSADDPNAAMQAAVDPYFQGADGGVTVNTTATPEFLAEDQRRFAIQQQQMSDAGLDPNINFSGMDQALHVGAEVVQGVESAVQTVETTAVQAYDAAASAVSSAVTTVEDAASSAYDSASSAVSSAVTTVEDAASSAYDAASSAVSSAVTTVEDTVSNAVDTVESWL